MGLDFCCDIQMVGSEFGIKNMKAWIHPALSQQSPDLNPIEHLWDVVEREIRIMDVQLTNLQQLRDASLGQR